MEWYEKEKAKGDWWKDLPKCPRKLCLKNGKPKNPLGRKVKNGKNPGKTPSPPGQYMNMYYEMRPLYAESDSEGVEERCCP